MTKTKTVPAARLCTPGAAAEWHTVDGLPGHYHPSIPVPLDAGLVTRAQLDAFLAAHADRVTAAAAAWETFRVQRLAEFGDIGAFQTPACPVELVELAETLVDEHAAVARDQRAQSARAAAKARRAGHAGEPNVKTELDAVGAQSHE